MKIRGHTPAIVAGSMILLLIANACSSKSNEVNPEDASPSVTLDYTFGQVVAFMSYSFVVNVTASSTSRAWGPSFLNTNEVYVITTETYVPDELLEFRAWFSQIGSADNRFLIQRLGSGDTRISIDRTVWPFPTDLTEQIEQRILKDIEEDISQWMKDNRAEQEPPRDGVPLRVPRP